MKVVELKYATSTGEVTAFVFTDDDGLVVSEQGLSDLVTELRRRKSTSLPHAEWAAFLDLRQACPRGEWAQLRQAYSAEMAASKNCTNCTKTAITRKYIKLLNELPNG